MKSVLSTVALAVMLGFGVSPAFAAPAPAAPAAGPSESQAVLAQWNDIGRKLIAMAEDFPEDKSDFNPTPPKRTSGAQLLHVAASMYYFPAPAKGKKPR